MKQLTIILTVSLFTLLNCGNKSAHDTVMPTHENQNEMPVTGHENNPYYSRTDTNKLDLPDSVWQKVLPEDVYYIARQKGTERPYSGKYWDYEGLGTYYCAACGNALFKSDAKFASSCGWPSFFQTLRKNSIEYKSDLSHGMIRTETLCGRCGGHLGHIFDDGPKPTGKRYCMNSLMLDFVPDKK